MKQSASKQTDEKPALLEGVYTNDLNIVEINKQVITNINIETKKSRELLPRRIEDLKSKLSKCVSLNDKKYYTRELEKVQESLEECVNGVKLKEYIENTTPIIEEYRKINPSGSKISFGMKCRTNQIESHSNPDILRLIETFLLIAEGYTSINFSRKTSSERICEFCDKPVPESFQTCSNFICPHCRAENQGVNNIYNSEIQSSSAKRDDEDIFIELVRKWFGERPEPFSQEFRRDFNMGLTSIGYPSLDTIQSKMGGKFDIPLTVILNICIQVSGSEHNNDINVIRHRWFGHPLVPKDDVDKIVEIIRDNYRSTQKIYWMTETVRSNTLNIPFLLYRHIQLTGYPVKASEFKIVSADALEGIKKRWVEMCEATGLPVHPMV
jgi:hypothetical protein